MATMMAYQVYSKCVGEWGDATPHPEIAALLDVYPDGVSITDEFGGTTRWRKAPRDGRLYKDISDAIAGRGDHKGTTPTERVYVLLEGRGIV